MSLYSMNQNQRTTAAVLKCAEELFSVTSNDLKKRCRVEPLPSIRAVVCCVLREYDVSARTSAPLIDRDRTNIEHYFASHADRLTVDRDYRDSFEALLKTSNDVLK